ncbi:MAG: enoyl-CoA hydratase-related protein [Planctomycetota bacterium]
MTNSIFVESISDSVARLVVATPECPYLGANSVSQLELAVEQLKNMPNLAAVVVTGTPENFCLGASRDALLSVDPSVGLSNYIEYFADVPRLLLSIPVPTIAAMRGHGIGGGFLLGLWCSSFVLAEECLYGANFMAIGITPGMGATCIVEEILGGPVGRQLLFSGRCFTGRELGKFAPQTKHCVAPRAEVEERALEIAERWSEQHVLSIKLLTETLNRKRLKLLDEAVEDEIRMHGQLFELPTIREEIAARYT